MEGLYGHNLTYWCGRASDDTDVGGDLGQGQGCHEARQLQVSTHLCSDLLCLDTGILARPPGLLPCGSGPVPPSFWTSVSLSVTEMAELDARKAVSVLIMFPPFRAVNGMELKYVKVLVALRRLPSPAQCHRSLHRAQASGSQPS